MTTLFRTYWTDAANQPHAQDCASLTEALALTESKRKQGMRFVTMVSESCQSVGQPGVSSVANGKLPDGHHYDWSKANRAGKVRRGDQVIATKDAN